MEIRRLGGSFAFMLFVASDNLSVSICLRRRPSMEYTARALSRVGVDFMAMRATIKIASLVSLMRSSDGGFLAEGTKLGLICADMVAQCWI